LEISPSGNISGLAFDNYGIAVFYGSVNSAGDAKITKAFLNRQNLMEFVGHIQKE